jgi:mannose-6-phosphate isomerase
MEHHPREMLGGAATSGGRFPLLVKILDAQDKLSLQVHPPASMAAALKGEPKTELWLVTATQPGAALYVGLKRGVTRADFERKIADGTVANCFHRHSVQPGDAMFLPSGRVHAIGAGNVVFEIQQNSDTTYRVFDWNRTGLDGRPRDLHVAQSLASIDFNDFEPALAGNATEMRGDASVRLLADCPIFGAELMTLRAGKACRPAPATLHILGVVSGALEIRSPTTRLALACGDFCLIPASVSTEISAVGDASFLRAEAGRPFQNS